MKKILIRSPEDLRRAMHHSPHLHDKPLGEILLSARLIDRGQLEQALGRQRRERSKHLGRILIDSGMLDREQVHAALAVKFGIPHVRLDYLDIDPCVLTRIPVELAIQHNVMPLAEIDGNLVVAMENPLDTALTGLLRFNAGRRVAAVMASARDIALAHSRYYSKFDEDEALESVRLDPPRPPGHAPESPLAIEREARKKPIVRLLNAIVVQGIIRGASDINIRPEHERVAVYYRIDGRLRYSRSLHKSLQPPLVSRVKIIGQMNIAERRLPQEGNVRLIRGGRGIDLRLSVIPTVDGESVVIRILDREAGLRPLAGLGLPAAQLTRLQRILARPHGLFLVTGPTGAGKSTTLYALLNELRKGGPHILTVEDPVEYVMEGIEQVQVAERIGLGFSELLRRFLRHDPDVIMVGEIRDRQTAAIANQAALTGHLVLSTLHTNDAPGAITRLVDMGIEPYIVASTLLGVMSQRLIRLNCARCSTAPAGPRPAQVCLPPGVDALPDEVLRRGRGCPSCNFTGYSGRTLVSEILEVTPDIASLIHRNAPARAIERLATEQGMQRLFTDALRLVRRGRTSLEEALALAGR